MLKKKALIIGFTLYLLESLWNSVELILVTNKMYRFGVIQHAIYLFVIIILAGLLTIKATLYANKKSIFVEIVLASFFVTLLHIIFGLLELFDWRFGILSSINTFVTTNIRENNYLSILGYFFVRSILYTVFLSIGAVFRFIIALVGKRITA